MGDFEIYNQADFFGISYHNFPTFCRRKFIASAGNRTRAARVAGEHSTTEPPMPTFKMGVKGDLEIYMDTNVFHPPEDLD